MGRRYPILLWETQSMRFGDQLEGHTAPVESLALLSDQRTLVSGSRDCTVRFWDVVARVELGSIRAFPDWVTRIAISPVDDVIAIAEAERREPRVREWGGSPHHYRSVDWSQAVGAHYSGPAFTYAGVVVQALRPEGVPESTRRKYLLDVGEGYDRLPAETAAEAEEETDPD
jgi:hypothetical protein